MEGGDDTNNTNTKTPEHPARDAGARAAGDQPADADNDNLLVPTQSWGTGSAPSIPSIDSAEQSDGSDTDSAVGGMSLMLVEPRHAVTVAGPGTDASVRTSTASLRSSIYEHVEENGRTYHRYKQGKYPLPNDEQEQERLDLQHALMGVTMEGKLHLAPIGPNPQNVLDIATGTGIWAVEFANLYPSAQVLGTDLSAIQPLYVPPNCRFEIDDAEDEWNFNEKFNYIHGRALLTCFRQPSAVIQQAYNALAPGGYLELQDGTFPFQYVGETPVDSEFYKWNEIVVEGAEKSGRPWTNAKHYKRWMEEIGFEDVVEKHFYWPTSPWPKGKYFKNVAAYWQEDLLSGLEGISLKVMASAGWSAPEILVFLAGVRKDIRDTSIHAYLPINVVYGRKPAAAP